MERYIVKLMDGTELDTPRPVKGYDFSLHGDYLELYDDYKCFMGMVKNDFVQSIMLVEEYDET